MPKMTKIVEVVPSYAWDCLVCSRRSYQEYGLIVFDWNNPDDMKTLNEAFSTEELAEMKAEYPNQLRIYQPRLYLTCQHCKYEFKLVSEETEEVKDPVGLCTFNPILGG